MKFIAELLTSATDFLVPNISDSASYSTNARLEIIVYLSSSSSSYLLICGKTESCFTLKNFDSTPTLMVVKPYPSVSVKG